MCQTYQETALNSSGSTESSNIKTIPCKAQSNLNLTIVKGPLKTVIRSGLTHS